MIGYIYTTSGGRMYFVYFEGGTSACKTVEITPDSRFTTLIY